MGESGFKQRDAASYDDAAETYARYIERLAWPLAERCCALARLRPGQRVLDVGCGTGIAARRAASVVGTGGRVIGVDLSPGMIEVARRTGSARLEFLVMDAESLEFESATFDAVVSLCAVLHFPDLPKALREMHRVLAPGGRLVVSFGSGRPSSLRALARHATARLRGRRLEAPAALADLAFGGLPPVEEQVLTEWALAPPLAALEGELHRLDLEAIERDRLAHEVVFDSPEEFWQAQVAIVTEARARIDHAPAQAVDAVREEFLARARQTLADGGRLVYPYGAVFLSAQKPARDAA